MAQYRFFDIYNKLLDLITLEDGRQGPRESNSQVSQDRWLMSLLMEGHKVTLLLKIWLRAECAGKG